MRTIQKAGTLFFSLLLSAVMLCLPAYAEGEPASITVGETTTPYTTVQDAIAAAVDGQTVNVLVSVTEDLTISKAITLKGQGHGATTIFGTINIDQSPMISGAVTIEDLTIGGTAGSGYLIKIANAKSNIPITIQGNKFAVENLTPSGNAVLVDAASYRVTVTGNIVGSNTIPIHSVLHIEGTASSDSQITVSNNNFPVSVTAAALSNLQGAVSVTGNILAGTGTGIGIDIIETAGRPVAITGNPTISNFSIGIRSKLAETTRAISNNAFAGNAAAISVDTSAVGGTIDLTGNTFSTGNAANIVKTNAGGARIVRSVSSGQSLAAAITVAEAGDTIHVAQGIYADSLAIDKSIKLVGTNQASVVSGTVTANAAGAVVEISGFELKGSTVSISNAAKAVLANNKFSGAALQLSGTADVSITDSTFPSAGVQVLNAAKADILRNTFSAAVTNAIEIGGVINTAAIESNTISNAHTGINYQSTGNAVVSIKGNTISSASTSAIDVGATAGPVTIEGNAIVGGGTGIFYHPAADVSLSMINNVISGTTANALKLDIPAGAATKAIKNNRITVPSGYAVNNLNSAVVNVADNYWGSPLPDFKKIMNLGTDRIIYSPYYPNINLTGSKASSQYVISEIERLLQGITDANATVASNTSNINQARDILKTLNLDKVELSNPAYKSILDRLALLYIKANSLTEPAITFSTYTLTPTSGFSIRGAVLAQDTLGGAVTVTVSNGTVPPNPQVPSDYHLSGKAVAITMSPAPIAPITISMPVPAGISSHNLAVVHYGSGELLPTSVSNNIVTFTTPGFSTFVFANRVSSSGGRDDSADEAFDFWSDIEDEILDAKSGDKIEVDARGIDRISAFMLNTLKGKNVTLVITTDEGKVTINGKTMKAVDKGRIYYTPEEFVKYFKTAAASSSSQSVSSSWKPPASSSTSVSQSVSSSESSEEPSSSSSSEVDVITQPEEPTPERNSNKEILLWGSLAAGALAILIIAVVISYHLGTKSKRF